MSKRSTIEWRWEAYYPIGFGDSTKQHVFKRGPVREDLAKVKKYADELREEIADLELPEHPNPKRHLSPYWRGAEIRILTRTLSPWTEVND